MVWLTQVLLGSYSLQTLWEQSGEVLVAMVAGVALQMGRSVRRVPQEAPSYRALDTGTLAGVVPTFLSTGDPVRRMDTR